MTAIERLERPAPCELDALTGLWEASVRATHRFLTPEEIGFYRQIVRNNALAAVSLYVVRDAGGHFTAFAGVAEGMLEMLFVSPDRRRQGLGRALVEHVVGCCGVDRVDVNEENPEAAAFYGHMGFRTVARDELDGFGRPHPILHLSLAR